ncbi:MAG: hypothetical protein Q9227_007830, partial [Pyrenula ochraceoflavens]
MLSALLTSPRRTAPIAFVLVVLLFLYGLYETERLPTNFWTVQSNLPHNDTGLMPLSDAQDFCASHNLQVWSERDSRRKVWDLTLINTELDWLEIRMSELWDHVDYFVVVEATRTFTNKPKALHLKPQLHRFEKFYPKLIYHVLDIDKMGVDYEGLGGNHERERYQRNSNLDFVFPSLLGEEEPQTGDVLI